MSWFCGHSSSQTRADARSTWYVCEVMFRSCPTRKPLASAIACGILLGAAVAFGSAQVPSRQASSPIAHLTMAFPPQTDRVALVGTPSGRGYWIADADGAVRAFGDAPTLGDLGAERLAEPVIAMASPSASGYWLADAAGAVRGFGVPDLGSAPPGLSQPVVAMAAMPHGNGYWLVTTDGRVFSFGDAAFHGSTGGARLDQPIVAMAATQTGNGYWLVAADGGVFSFGDAAFDGATGSGPPSSPVVAVMSALGGYRLLGRDGQVYAFGGADNLGDALTAPFGVGVRTVNVIDPARPTPARGSSPAHAGRNLVTTILYPANVSPTSGEVADAAASSSGPFPLVVFAHGFAVTPETYRVLLDEWVAAGYVVAAPEFPLSSADGSGPPSRADLAEQPGDLAATIGFVAAAADDPNSWLSGLVDPTRIAEAGQSDGGSTVAAATLNSAAHDPRVTAAMTLSGAELTLPGGSYGHRANVPLLVVQGDRDPTNPPSAGAAIYNDAETPKGYLDVIGGGHMSPYIDTTPQASLVRSCTLDFLDYELDGSIDGLVRLRRDGNSPSLTSLRDSFS